MTRILAFSFALALAATLRAEPLNRTPAPGEYHTPQQTVDMMKLPEGFKVQVFAGEPDISQPIAFCTDARGRLWFIENHSYPNWKETGNDRIHILEDTDGDGKYDKKTLFWDKGNFATGIAVGFGGVYVGSPPNLLFIPDKDGDDKPDGDPIVLLDGWGHHDTHETVNSFIWGPDGWLYGCQGVFTYSKVGKPGTPDDQRIPLNACIWRYHPTKHQFEIFSEGGSNQWGVDFNDYGHAFMTACVIPHLYHMIQGGRYIRQGGPHANPYTYDDIKTIRTHSHFAAAFAGAMIYLGDQFPDMYRNQIFMNNIHASKVHVDLLDPVGSGYVGKLGPHDVALTGERKIAPADERGAGFINNGDKWVRGLYMSVAPDGGVYLNDWYDQLPCHQLQPHDQTIGKATGRIYKITYGNPAPVKDIDVDKNSNEELVKMQLRKNDWWVRTARRVLAERAARGQDMSDARAALTAMLNNEKDVTRQLRALWALHVISGDDEALLTELLDNPSEHLRSWAIQLECEDNKASDAIVAKYAALAKSDPSPVVRLFIASALQRLPLEQRWAVAEQLIKHGEDAKDHNLELMYWYAIEPLVGADKPRGLKLAAAAAPELGKLRQFIARRATEK